MPDDFSDLDAAASNSGRLYRRSWVLGATFGHWYGFGDASADIPNERIAEALTAGAWVPLFVRYPTPPYPVIITKAPAPGEPAVRPVTVEDWIAGLSPLAGGAPDNPTPLTDSEIASLRARIAARPGLVRVRISIEDRSPDDTFIFEHWTAATPESVDAFARMPGVVRRPVTP